MLCAEYMRVSLQSHAHAKLGRTYLQHERRTPAACDVAGSTRDTPSRTLLLTYPMTATAIDLQLLIPTGLH